MSQLSAGEEMIMLRLRTVQKKDRDLLWNINQKYLYEMTNFYDDPMDDSGNYHYGHFDDYFSDPMRVSYFIFNDDVLVGFAMLCPYSNVDQNPDYMMAEFTIFPAYRRKHFALDAARMILDKHPGKWEIKYNEKNSGAKKLWNAVATPYNPEVYHLNVEETVLSFKTAEKIIAACGNDCAACPRYTAHPYEKTDEELHHTAELWMKIGYRDHIVTNEEIACYGCKPENWCRYRVIKCCVDRGIKNCGECAEYPCDNIKECFKVTKSFEPMCRQVCTDDEYKRLEKAFFEKEKNLSVKMVKLEPARIEDTVFYEKDENRQMDYSIKKVNIGDYDAIFELWNATEQSRRALNPVDDSWEGIARYLKRNPDTCFAAVKDNRIIGVILTGHDGRRAIVHHLCVHPDYRHMGIAGHLVSIAEKALQKEGIQKIFGLVFKDNESANAFWEQQGYSLRTNLNYRNKSLNDQIPAGE